MVSTGQAVALRGGRLIRFILLPLAVLWPQVGFACTDSDSIATMVAKVTPGVVRLIAMRPPSHKKSAKGTDVFNGLGSGYIINPSGYIGTNKHLIDGATSVFVITADGGRYRASVVGLAAQADIALLRIDVGAKLLPFVRFGDSDKVHIGDRVIAIGNPLGFGNTVTSGIISAINRDIEESPFDDYLQTDASINHGNSGGPLFNTAGEVIGMTSVLFSPDRGSAGLGFAVPSNGLQFVFDRLMKTGKVDAGRLPIRTQPVSWGLEQAFQMPDLKGALVTSVDAGLNGSIHAGDVITSFNGQEVLDPRDLARKAARLPIGSDTAVGFHRGERNETIHVTTEALPEAKPVPRDDRARALGLKLTTRHGNGRAPVVMVASVDPTGTAAESGLVQGDSLIEIQQTPISQPDEAMQALSKVASENLHFAAVLVRHAHKLVWRAVEVPNAAGF